MPRKKKDLTENKVTEAETEEKSEKADKSKEKSEADIEKKIKKTRKKEGPLHSPFHRASELDRAMASQESEEKVKEEIDKESEKAEEKEVLEEKKRKLKERAKILAEKLGEKEEAKEDLAEFVREKKVKGEKAVEMLVSLEDYVKCGIHLGTKVIMPWMKQYVYRRRADGLAVLNTEIIDKKIREAIPFLTGFDAKDIILVCKREAGWKPAIMFSEITGIRAFTKKYPAGIMTNPILENFFEPELVIICDPWIDKNALSDAKITGKSNKRY
ncbi:hypothetical protein HYV49_00290 [Candidatus Pacearchaeota archaeon]|nr:hypothetical protein [Candidatus Pacearchaeota archaeon]